MYDSQHQLKILELTEPLDLERFTWLSSDSVEELKLKTVNSSNSIAGIESLSNRSSVKKLTLDLSYSQVSNLEPLSKLTRLQTLSIENATRAQRMSLRKIPVSLIELKF